MNLADYHKEIADMLLIDLDDMKSIKEMNFRTARNLWMRLKELTITKKE